MLGPQEAPDAWSETFLSALKAYPDLRADSNVRGWLVTIAHRKAIDQIRVARRVAVPTDTLPEVASQDDMSLGDAELSAALQRLTPKQCGAIVYRYLADLSYAEVAALLECSEAAARKSASDGIANLRKSYLPAISRGPHQ